MLHRNNLIPPWSPPMNAKPNPGLCDVGGATPNRGAALADEVAVNIRCPNLELPPAAAMLAALSWHANQAITRQVGVTYSLADLVRSHGLAVAETVESSLPEGPLRDAMTAATNAYIQCAENTALAATRYGRHFGHLAFAFPRPES
jgi:hypothetical protein